LGKKMFQTIQLLVPELLVNRKPFLNFLKWRGIEMAVVKPPFLLSEQQPGLL